MYKNIFYAVYRKSKIIFCTKQFYVIITVRPSKIINTIQNISLIINVISQKIKCTIKSKPFNKYETKEEKKTESRAARYSKINLDIVLYCFNIDTIFIYSF